jgi:FMN-dependent NADH-azoreductase
MKDIDKKIIYLYSSGNSFNKISVETKKSKPYIRKILIESGIEVKNLKNTPEFYRPAP